MGATLNSTGVTFNDTTSQNTAWTGPNFVRITSTQSWTVPTGITKVKVCVVGGGGGGGAVFDNGSGTWDAAGGGAAGGYAIKWVTGLTPGSSVTCTVGAAGTAGAAGNPGNGGTGGTSSFGAYCSATGGTGGRGVYNSTTAFPAISGGTGSGGDYNVTGDGVSSNIRSGANGYDLYGKIGIGGTGGAASGYASGGAGAAKLSGSGVWNGYAGTAGTIIIEW